MVRKNATCLIFLWSMISCTSVPQELKKDVFYPRDMTVELEGGHVYPGWGVLPYQDSYKLKVWAKGNLDLFAFTTCHRERIIENAGQKGLFGNKRYVEQTFAPNKNMELQNYCPIALAGYEKGQGRHSWAFFDIETPDAKLPANVECNGWMIRTNGVSVCQARSGLLQKIVFPEEVLASSKCALPKKQGKEFVFPLSVGECVYAFKEKNGTRLHRLTTLGYEEILIRGD